MIRKAIAILIVLASTALSACAGTTVMADKTTGALMWPPNLWSGNLVVTNANLLSVSNLLATSQAAASNEMRREIGVAATNLTAVSNVLAGANTASSNAMRHEIGVAGTNLTSVSNVLQSLVTVVSNEARNIAGIAQTNLAAASNYLMSVTTIVSNQMNIADRTSASNMVANSNLSVTLSQIVSNAVYIASNELKGITTQNTDGILSVSDKVSVLPAQILGLSNTTIAVGSSYFVTSNTVDQLVSGVDSMSSRLNIANGQFTTASGKTDSAVSGVIAQSNRITAVSNRFESITALTSNQMTNADSAIRVSILSISGVVDNTISGVLAQSNRITIVSNRFEAITSLASNQMTNADDIIRIGLAAVSNLHDSLSLSWTNSAAYGISSGNVSSWNSLAAGTISAITASGGVVTIDNTVTGMPMIVLTTNMFTNVAVRAGLVTASITNTLSDRVSILDTGKVSIAQGVALTNDLRGDIADGLDFSTAPTVNGNPVSTNSGGAGAETDPVYTTGLTARLSGLLGTAAYSNGTAFIHASRIGELTNETLFKIFTNNATWYGTEQVTVTPTNEFTINETTITGYTGTNANVVIPHEIGGYIIDAIDASVFANNDIIKSVIFPANPLFTIGNTCFQGCDNLEFVTFNEQLQSVGTSAFESCPKLVSVIFKKGVPPADNTIYEVSTHVTNYVSTDTYDWGPTFSGRPVSIPPLCTYRLEVNRTNVMEVITSNTEAIASLQILRARTNSAPIRIEAPALGVYASGRLYGTNAIINMSRSMRVGHMVYQSGYQTNDTTPFFAVDGSHLASTTNQTAAFTNISIPPGTLYAINVTSISAVASNFVSDTGYQEP